MLIPPIFSFALQIVLVVVVIGTLLKGRAQESVTSALNVERVPATHIAAETVVPELTVEQRATALREAVERWKAARALDDATAMGACRRTQE